MANNGLTDDEKWDAAMKRYSAQADKDKTTTFLLGVFYIFTWAVLTAGLFAWDPLGLRGLI